jgi:hypothetical protein
MATPPNRSGRRTGDQVLIDNNVLDIQILDERVRKLERFVYWACGAAMGMGFVIGLFAKPVARLIFP